MEAFHAVGEDGLASWCEAWNGAGRLLPRAPADLRHESATLSLCERFASGPRARPSAVGALRRHFAFRQDTRLALDLHVRPELRGRGVARHYLHEVECDRFLLLELDRATTSSQTGPEARLLAAEPGGSEQAAWQLEQHLHASLDTSAPYVQETFTGWRARVLEAPGSGPETVLVTRTPGGELAGLCALRVCVAHPETVYHAFTGVAESARGQGHGLALKLAAIRRARELGARRLVADTSPRNTPMLALNQRLGYVAALDVRNLEGAP
jgi:ribosomal protein S18 acetylase RimI-like enzyme